jgi:hypothetical protein
MGRMNPSPRWSPGEVIVLQDVYGGKLWAARPVIVVEDSADVLALWCPEGTVRKVPSTAASIPAGMTRGEWLARGLARLEWPLIDSPWDVSSLMLHREGDWYGIWLSFLASGEHWGWYVNFQEPYRRTEHGIQTMDMALDIIVEPDRSSWRWKDEDEFALLLDHGVIDAAAAARVRGEADRVIGLIERDEPPFDSAWPRWKPDPAWGRPGLPEGWEIV